MGRSARACRSGAPSPSRERGGLAGRSDQSERCGRSPSGRPARGRSGRAPYGARAPRSPRSPRAPPSSRPKRPSGAAAGLAGASARHTLLRTERIGAPALPADPCDWLPWLRSGALRGEEEEGAAPESGCAGLAGRESVRRGLGVSELMAHYPAPAPPQPAFIDTSRACMTARQRSRQAPEAMPPIAARTFPCATAADPTRSARHRPRGWHHATPAPSAPRSRAGARARPDRPTPAG